MATTQEQEKKPASQTGGYKDRFWIPRFWDGMRFGTLMRLLAKNRFAASPSRWGLTLIIALIGPIHFVLCLLQHFFYGRKVAATEIKHQPIFIIGHWRSGTTMLHELLVLDSRHTYADTYACFAPNHFVLSRHFLPRMLRFLLPSQRPIDNMAAGWERPQEDEFAMCNMGLPSPYLTICFPNRPPQDQEYLDFQGVSAEDKKRWQEGLAWFLKCLTLVNPKRIVLKSPAHTSRIQTLLEQFPDARFVHIVRNPYVVFPSTVNLWKRLYLDQGFQKPKYAGLEEHVFTTFNRMYDAFEAQRDAIPPGRFCEVRYEELVEDATGQMERIYAALELGQFEAARPALEEHLAGLKGYKTNRYQISPEIRSEITRRWGGFLAKYGYEEEQAEVEVS